MPVEIELVWDTCNPEFGELNYVCELGGYPDKRFNFVFGDEADRITFHQLSSVPEIDFPSKRARIFVSRYYIGLGDSNNGELTQILLDKCGWTSVVKQSKQS